MDRHELVHHRTELLEGQLLLGVGQGGIGVRVDLDHHSVGPNRDAAHRQRRDEPSLAGGMAGVDDHGQVT